MTSLPLDRRAAGPDLSRGIALLGIVLANTVGWLHGSKWTVLLKQADATAGDRAVDALVALLADNRGFPLFALLFGYGIGVLHRRSRERGERPGRFLRRMLRRHAVLLGIGLAHALFLFSGDILVAYAIIGMLCAVLITRHRAVLPAAAVLALPALGVWGWADGVIGLGGDSGYAAASAPDYLSGLELRAGEALRETALAPIAEIALLTPMAIGAVAARMHLFEQVAANRDVLVPLTRWGLLLGLLGAVPLTAVLVLDPAHTQVSSAVVLGVLGAVHQYSGLLFAVGTAAGCALLAARFPPAGRRATTARDVTAAQGRSERTATAAVQGVSALGAVSLTAYLAQSLVFAALFPPYALDLGATLGSAGAAGIGLASWLLMIPLALALQRRGVRGPAEHLLRRLAGSASPRSGTSRTDVPRAAAPRNDVSRTDVSRTDVSRTDVSRTDVSRTDVSRTDPPASEASTTPPRPRKARP